MQYLFAQRNTSPELQEQLYRYIHAPLQLDQPSLLDRVNRWIDNKFSVPGTPKVRRPVQQPEPVKELFPLLQPAFELPEQPLPEEVQVQQVHEQLPDPLLQARDEDQPYWSLVDEDVTVLIDPLVGKRVDVFWSSEATWFSGLVRATNNVKHGSHLIHYDSDLAPTYSWLSGPRPPLWDVDEPQPEIYRTV